MKKSKLLATTLILVSFIASSCVTKKKISDDDFAMEDEPSAVENLSLDSSSDTSTDASAVSTTTNANEVESSNKDEFADFAEEAASTNNSEQQVSTQTTENVSADELTLDEAPSEKVEDSDLQANNGTTDSQSNEANPPEPEVLSLDESQATQSQDTNTLLPTEVKPEVVQEPVQIPQPPIEQVPVETQMVAPSVAQINDLKFLANDSGGTLVISSDKSLQFRTRMNTANNQLIVEVQDAIVPDRLKRPLNTKDMTSTIGGIDIYQNRGSKIARFVIQLRANSPEPVVQPEGNSILVVGSLNSAVVKNSMSEAISDDAELSKTAQNNEDGLGILGSESLDDFLANNNKYYGRKINFEVNNMDVDSAIKFIAEESGINLIMDNGIGAGTVTMKLRNVPWDQVFVAILKSNQLAYRRQGDVIRIGTQKALIDEEDSAIQLKRSREELEPLVVKNFLINYAKIDELETKIRDFISQSASGGGAGGAPPAPAAGASGAGASRASSASAAGGSRGRVTSDPRTNIIIVTETASKLKEVEKLINLLDRQPQQVLVEARVVEATESYGKAVGVNFCTNGFDGLGCNIAGSSRINSAVNGVGVNGQTLTASPAMQFAPDTGGSFGASLWLGTLGSFGDIATSLSLDETDNKVKILSSPRLYLIHSTPGEIKQTTNIQQPRLEQSAVATGAVATSFEAVPVGLTLKVTPFISSIGTVRLNLNLDRGAVGQNNAISNRSITNEIIVRSGETAVVGGIYTSDVTDQNTGIPGLRNIPILGWLFRSESLSKLKTELMFFVSPRILNDLNTTTQAAAEQQASKF